MRELDAAARDRLIERLGEVGGSGLAGAAIDAEGEVAPLTKQDPGAWWERLIFDEAGDLVEYQGESWRPRELAAADTGLARYAAAVLKTKDSAPNKNNSACCMCYADPAALPEARRLFEEIDGESKAAENLAILDSVDPRPEPIVAER